MDKDKRKSIDWGDFAVAEDILIWRRELIRRVLRVMLVFGGLMVVAGAYASYSRGIFWATLAYVGAYGILVLLAFWRQAPYALQVGGVQLLLYVVSVVVFITRGLGDSSRVYLLTMVFIAALFLGWRSAFVTLGVVMATMIGMGWAFTTGQLVAFEVVSTALDSWISLTIELLSMGIFIALLLNYYTFRFDVYMTHSRELAQALEDNQAGLEIQVAERTAALEKRSVQLEAAMQVAREAAQIQQVDTLLEQTAQLISERFGFYHTGIFLTDEAGEYAVLHAVSSDAGRRMLARGHRLRVGEVGVVGYVTQQGEPRISQDVSADEIYFDNPEMPATRSEMALPLRVRGEIIGALDMQSTEPAAFTQEDRNVLQTLADQLAVAIANARLLTESQVALAATQQAYGEVSRKAWQEMLRARTGLRVRYDPQKVLSLAASRSQDLSSQQARLSTAAADKHLDARSIPLMVRGQVIGALDAYMPGAEPWTAAHLELLETLSEQLSVALDSARLFEDAQQRAQRERVVGEVATQMRASLDLESVLQTAVREMARSLDIPEVELRLWSGSDEEGTL